MKKLTTALASYALVLTLTGCAAPGVSVTDPLFGWLFPQPQSTPQPMLSDPWNKAANLKASTVIADLERVNYCLPPASEFQAPDESTDYGKAWAADQLRSCQDFETVDDAAGGCQLVYYVSVGKDNIFDPKRSLIYEDSMSVALLYGENWQLELSPARGAADPIEATKANCQEYVQKLIETVGGNVTRLGQYD